jgi:hypothetical protein
MKNFLITGVKFLFFTPVALISVAVLYFFYCEANKAYWDYRVKEMCLKDGGVTVFEKVELTKEEYERNDGRDGFIVPKSERRSKNKHDFYKEQDTEILHKSNPVVKKLTFYTYRKSDGKLLGKMVIYGRTDGDFPTGISAGSSFSCADMKTIPLDTEKQIFTVKGE